MFCANCGAVLKHCSKFCHACGQKVENDIGGNETDKGATKCLRFKSYAARGLLIFDQVARRRRGRRGKKKIPSH